MYLTFTLELEYKMTPYISEFERIISVVMQRDTQDSAQLTDHNVIGSTSGETGHDRVRQILGHNSGVNNS